MTENWSDTEVPIFANFVYHGKARLDFGKQESLLINAKGDQTRGVLAFLFEKVTNQYLRFVVVTQFRMKTVSNTAWIPNGSVAFVISLAAQMFRHKSPFSGKFWHFTSIIVNSIIWRT